MKAVLENKYFPFVIVGIFVFIRMSYVGLVNFGDDAYYSTVLKDAWDVFAYTVHRCTTWSSRISSEFFSTLIMRENLWIWRVLNTFFFILLVFGIYRISALGINKIDYKLRIVSVFGIALALSVANLSVMNEAIVGVTYSFFYLWPAAFMVIVLYLPFKLFEGVDSSKRYVLYYLPFVLYFSFLEQTVLIFVSFLVISMIVYYFRSHKISYTGLWFFLPVVACMSFLVLSPGNLSRFKREVTLRYPIFTDMTFFEKVFHGSSYTVFYNLLSDNAFVTILLSLIIIYIIFKYKNAICLKIVSFFPLLYMVVGLIYKSLDKNAFNSSTLYNFWAIATEKVAETSGGGVHVSHISFYVGLFVVMLFPFFFYKIFGRSIFFFECLLLFGASLMSSFILSFSPTIFASSKRIFFVGNVMLVILLSKLFLKAVKMDKHEDAKLSQVNN